MKKCNSCQTEIDEKATKCPHCQGDQRSWFRRHPILTGLLVLFIIGMFGSVVNKGGSNPESNQATSQNEQVTVTPTPEATKINVRALGDEFDANQVAAANKWKGQLVEFSAEISNITNSGLSFQNVTNKAFSMTQISCRIKDKAQLLPLKNGQTITVRGIVGTQMLGVIGLSDCEVVE